MRTQATTQHDGREMPARPTTPEARRALHDFLEAQTPALLANIGLYIRRLGLTDYGESDSLAHDVLHEAVVEAIAHADRFDPTRSPMAWMLGVAFNVIRRKRAELAKRRLHEVSARELSSATRAGDDDTDVDGYTPPARALDSVASPERDVLGRAGAEALLALVSPDDQQVLRLAVLDEMTPEALARRLGVGPGAARMRLSRAIRRLRMALIARSAAGDGVDGENNA